MPKILISYRRSDSDAIAGRVRDRLAAYYGDESLFMDIDNIPFGTDFREHIRAELLSSDIVIVVIGPKWLGQGDGGRKRIMNESDPVRIEVELALENGLRVVPILVNGATMPTPADLPKSLRDLSFRNAAEVESGRDFHPHMDRLIRSLDRILGSNAKPQADTQSAPPSAAVTSAPPSPGVVSVPPPSLPVTLAAPPSPRFSSRAILAATGAVVVLLAFSLGAWLLLAPGDAGRTAQPRLEPKPPPRLEPKPKLVETPAPKPAKSAASGCSSDMAAPVLDDRKVPDPGPALRDELTGAINGYFRCSTVPFDTLARTFATISVVVPHHISDAKCFGGDTRIVVASWADQKAWADRQGREDLLWVSLRRTVEQAIDCLDPDRQKLFFADVARAFSAATTRIDSHTFANPSLNGRRIDRCLYYARDCNGPAADAWCRRFGFERVVKWDWEYVFPTYTLGDRLVCPAKGCGAFSVIVCAR